MLAIEGLGLLFWIGTFVIGFVIGRAVQAHTDHQTVEQVGTTLRDRTRDLERQLADLRATHTIQVADLEHQIEWQRKLAREELGRDR